MNTNQQDGARVTAVPKLPRRAADAHKGDCGRVLVIAGSQGMSGAAILCGSAALRGGAGLVTVACPETIADVVAAGNPCLMTRAIDSWDRFELPPADVIVIGPGLGTSVEAATMVNELLTAGTMPIVVDADALNNWRPTANHAGPRILTPHPGEFARLIGRSIAEVQQHRETWTADFAERFACTVVLKGHGTIVSDGRHLYRNTTGNPGMATAGAGDVLAGLIGALIGQGLEPFAAAQLAVYLHGLAGDIARDTLGEWSLTASDLLDYLPRAFREHAADPS